MRHQRPVIARAIPLLEMQAQPSVCCLETIGGLMRACGLLSMRAKRYRQITSPLGGTAPNLMHHVVSNRKFSVGAKSHCNHCYGHGKRISAAPTQHAVVIISVPMPSRDDSTSRDLLHTYTTFARRLAFYKWTVRSASCSILYQSAYIAL